MVMSTVCPRIYAWAFISIPDLGDPASKRDQRLIWTSIYKASVHMTARISRKYSLLAASSSLETSKKQLVLHQNEHTTAQVDWPRPIHTLRTHKR